VRRTDGIRISAWATMPSVVPMPRTSSFGSPNRTGSRLISPGTATKAARTPSTTTLFSTGAQANGPNTPRVFNSAPSMAPTP
jgi:hypothetical protein